jgi:hypothetical protein
MLDHPNRRWSRVQALVQPQSKLFGRFLGALIRRVACDAVAGIVPASQRQPTLYSAGSSARILTAPTRDRVSAGTERFAEPFGDAVDLIRSPVASSPSSARKAKSISSRLKPSAFIALRCDGSRRRPGLLLDHPLQRSIRRRTAGFLLFVVQVVALDQPGFPPFFLLAWTVLSLVWPSRAAPSG